MSRIGKQPITVPDKVELAIVGQMVKAKGPKGELQVTLTDEVVLDHKDGVVTVQPRNQSKKSRSQYGLSRTLIQNIVTGVTDGFSKTLEITGVGYRAQMKGKDLSLALGLSHDVNYPVPQGIDITTPKPTEIVISGIDKQMVGQVAAEIRSWRPPEPYKGKGIKYQGEYIFRKEGKKK